MHRRSKVLPTVLAALAMCLTALGAAPAEANQGNGGGGTTTVAECHAYTESLATSGSDVVAKMTVSCNVIVVTIQIYGGLQRSGTGGDQVAKYKSCTSVASCTLTLTLANPSGSQKFSAMWAPDTMVIWPNFSSSGSGPKLGAASSNSCPDMGCRMVSINA